MSMSESGPPSTTVVDHVLSWFHTISFSTVPEAHVRERRVGPTQEDEEGPERPIRPLIRLGSAAARPQAAFAAVRYRGHWFAIDDQDMPSKRLFTPRFKGVWSTAVNFAPLPLLDTRSGQYPQRHR